MIEIFGFSESATGNHDIALNGSFTPTYLEFKIAPRKSTTETTIRCSYGASDLNNSYAVSLYADGSGHLLTKETTSYAFWHHEWNGTAFVKVLSGTLVSTGLGTFRVNLDTVNVNYEIRGAAFE
jgi:hypothetical protein